MKKWVLNRKLMMIGVILGCIGGYAYYHFIGCTSGTCLISSKPLNSTLYFGLMGGLFMSMFKSKSDGNKRKT
jgi:LytS/YehU family sensor histidine kinase